MFVNFDDVKVNYNVIYSDKPNAEFIVMIHGVGLDMTTWDYIVPYLKKDFNILTYDLRGHGLTVGNEENIQWKTLVADFFNLLSFLNIQSCHLLVTGIGGNLALQIIKENPKAIKKVIFASVYFYFPGDLTQREIESRKKSSVNGNVNDLINKMIPQICYPITDEKEQLLKNAYSKVNIKTYFHLVELAVTTMSVEQLSGIDNEVLILQGDYDSLYPIQQMILTQSYLENSTTYVIQNASNTIYLDQPRILSDYVRNFLLKSKETALATDIKKELSIKINEMIINGNEAGKRITQPKQLEINMINGFNVVVDGNTVIDKWNQRKAKNLLAYLAFHQSVTREELIDEFWANTHLESARNNLRVSLNHLKRIFKKHDMERFLIVDNEHVYLTDVECDLVDFLNRLNHCFHNHDLASKVRTYNSLINIYNKKFLVGFYDEWIMEVRNKIDFQLIQISEELAKTQITKGNYIEAIEYLKDCIRTEQYQEFHYDQIINLYRKLNKFEEAEIWEKKKVLLDN